MSLDTLPEPLTQLHARLAALDIEREAIEQDCVFYPEASRAAGGTGGTILRDELQAEAGHLEAQYQQEKALAQQIMTLRQEGTTALNCNSNCERIRALHRCWRWMWTPAPSPRWWRTGPASRSSLLKDEQSDLLSMERALKTAWSGKARRSAPSHSGCGRLKPASRRRTAHRGIPADRPQRHR